MIRRIIFLLIGLCLIERFCHLQTEGFQCFKIFSDLSFDSKWETLSLNDSEVKEIQTIFSQPFYFLGSGGQCYAFVSQDDQYVVKFFKHHHMRQRRFYDSLPLPSFLDKTRKKWIENRKKQLQRTFSSFKIAFERFKKQTGLIYLHLNKSDLFHQKLKIVDKIGIAHLIEIDQVEFALQKKATLALPEIKMCMQKQKIEIAKEHLAACLKLIIDRSKAGICDCDPVMKRNFGFIENEAVEIDLGSFATDEFLQLPHNYKRELFYETLKLKKWTKKNYPELVPFLEKTIQNFLEEN